MYIQLTTRCNMTCEHCIFSCGTDRVVEADMSPSTFRKVLAWADNVNANIALGGGEPTMHRKFWEYLGISLGSQVENVWLATNGSNKEIALALNAMAEGYDRFSVELSLDEYHDPIDEEVVQAFKATGRIRTVKRLADHGSARFNGIGTEPDCLCGGAHIKPNGDVYPCACDDAPLLCNVNTTPLDVLDTLYVAFKGNYCHRQFQHEDVSEEDYDDDLPQWEDINNVLQGLVTTLTVE